MQPFYMISYVHQKSYKHDAANLIFCSVIGFNLLICNVCSSVYFFSIFALLNFALFIAFFILNWPSFVVKYLSYLFSAVAAISGTAICELIPGLFLDELRCDTAFAGSLPLLIFAYWMLLMSLYLYDLKKGVPLTDISFLGGNAKKRAPDKITVILFVLFTILFSKVASRPAMLLGIDRFQYAKNFAPKGIWASISNVSSVLLIFPFLSLLYGNRYLGTLTIVLYVLYHFWMGTKFGPFFSMMCVGLLVSYNYIARKGKRFLKKANKRAIALFACLVLFAVCFSSISDSYKGDGYFFKRCAQQGQLWWKTYQLAERPSPSDFSTEIDALLHPKRAVSENVGSQNGIYRIMYLCAPKEMVDFKLSTGSRYSEGGCAAAYYYFGTLGVVLYTYLSGLISAITVNAFIMAVKRRQYIKEVILLRFFIQVRACVVMFVFLDLLDKVSLCGYCYLALSWGIRKRIKIQL